MDLYPAMCVQNERFITIVAYSGLLLQSLHIVDGDQCSSQQMTNS